MDYRRIVGAVDRVMRGPSRLTLEFLAQEVGRGVLALPGVRAVNVRVTKLCPPLTPGATSAIELDMERA